jgi:hypothetical protein
MTCGHPLIAESIYLKTGVSTRREIGQVGYCPTCNRIRGDAKKSDELKESEWQLMARVRPQPPFYFERIGESLVPEGHRVDAKPVAQDLAAGDYQEGA